MLYRGVVLFSALSLVLGHLPSSQRDQPSETPRLSSDTFDTPSPQPTSSDNRDANETDVNVVDVMGFCLFGSIPTATCMVKCFWKSKSTYCDEEANCRCAAEDEEDDVERSQEDYTTHQPVFDSEEGVMGVCYFATFPSPSCVFRCSVRGESAVCDEESRCLCEDHTWREVFTPTHPLDSDSVQDLTRNESQSDDDAPVVFFILDLGGLFESEDDEVKEDPLNSCTPPYELWTVPHIVAMTILTLVAVLLVLELTLCCKRRYSHPSKQHLVEVLEKGMSNGKPQCINSTN